MSDLTYHKPVPVLVMEPRGWSSHCLACNVMKSENTVNEVPKASCFGERVFCWRRWKQANNSHLFASHVKKFWHSLALSNFQSGDKETNLEIIADIWVGPMKTAAMEKTCDKEISDRCSICRNDWLIGCRGRNPGWIPDIRVRCLG